MQLGREQQAGTLDLGDQAAQFVLELVQLVQGLLATLADVAQLSTEGSGVTCTDFCYKGVIAVSAEPAVYIAASFFMPLVSFRFSLPED